MGIFPDRGSFFDANVWVNYLPPGTADWAVFGRPWPMSNGNIQHAPHTLYFGNVELDVPFMANPVSVSGGNAEILGLAIFNDSWTFDFGSASIGVGAAIPQPFTGSLTIHHGGIGQPDWADPSRAPGNASLTVRNGVLTQAQPGGGGTIHIGDGLDSVGTLIVDGDGAAVQAAGPIYLGNAGGSGTLQVVNGGQVGANHVGSGGYRGPNGELRDSHVLVSGQGSLLSGLGNLEAGSITIEDGGEISNALPGGQKLAAALAVGDGAEIHAQITGSGSKWVDIDWLAVGGIYHTDSTGKAYLNVSNGGELSTREAHLGWRSLSRGEVTITGTGSKWTNEGWIHVGDDGTGILKVSSGGVINTGVISSGFGANGRGTVTIQGGTLSASEAAFAGWAEGAEGSFTIDGAGSRLHVGHFMEVGGSPDLDPGGVGTVTITAGGLATVGQRLEMGGKGVLDLLGGGRAGVGNVDADAIPSGELHVGPGGLLVGSGEIRGHVVILDGGVLSAGFSPGTLSIDSLALSESATVVFEIGGTAPGEYDVIAVAGNASLAGLARIEFVNGFEPAVGDRFDLIQTAGTQTGSFDAIEILNSGPTPYQMVLNEHGFQFHAVPEPTTWAWTMAAALGSLACLRNRFESANRRSRGG